MNLTNIKARQKDSGFTIVELLVVIVVIGILAAITIVSYTGITTRANTAQNQSNSSSVQSAVSAYYADKSSYPAWNALGSAKTIEDINVGAAKVPTSIVLQNSPPSAGSSIGYVVIGTTGVCISYWDYAANAVRYDGVGNVTVPATGISCG